MTPDTPAMDEKGLKAARIAADEEWRLWTGGRSGLDGMEFFVRSAIAAYLAATARSFKHCDGCDGHECTDSCKYPEPVRDGTFDPDPPTREYVNILKEEIRLLRASLKALQEAEVVKEAVWRVILLPDDRTIKDDLIFTFVHKAEFEAFCNGCRANQSAWSITDICEYQASTAARALDAIANAIPGEDDDAGSCLATPQPSPDTDGDAA